MSGPASLFLFVASSFAPSCLLAVPLRIAQRQECPAELKAFLKSRSIRIRSPDRFGYHSLSLPAAVPSGPLVSPFVLLGVLGNHIGSLPRPHNFPIVV